MKSYPRTLSGLLVIVLCLFMAWHMRDENVWISIACIVMAVLRGGVLVRDLSLARKGTSKPTEASEVQKPS